jgi:phage-related tail protein
MERDPARVEELGKIADEIVALPEGTGMVPTRTQMKQVTKKPLNAAERFIVAGAVRTRNARQAGAQTQEEVAAAIDPESPLEPEFVEVEVTQEPDGRTRATVREPSETTPVPQETPDGVQQEQVQEQPQQIEIEPEAVQEPAEATEAEPAAEEVAAFDEATQAAINAVPEEARTLQKAKAFIREGRRKAENRREAGRSTLPSGIDPRKLADEIIIAASYIAEGAITLADFTTRMVQQFGEEIRP